MRQYKEPDWGEILLDLVYWGVTSVGGWAIELMPSDMLLGVWEGISLRRMREINLGQYTAAVAFDNKVAAIEKRRKLTPDLWLPYNLSPDPTKPQIPAAVLEIMISNRDRLPEQMVVELFRQNILTPADVWGESD